MTRPQNRPTPQNMNRKRDYSGGYFFLRRSGERFRVGG
jgi:hypothetical protein